MNTIGRNWESFALDPQLGAMHERKDLPCEDAAACYQGSRFSVAVISDGHGSENSCRSKDGSKFAVETVVESASRFFDELETDSGEVKADKVVKNLAQLKRSILLNWKSKVFDYTCEKPFDPDGEYKQPKERYAKRYLSSQNIESMYGATLNAVVVCESMWFSLKIGDGTFAARTEDGYLAIVPDTDTHQQICFSAEDIERVEENSGPGEKTESLCSSRAGDCLIVHFGLLEEQPDCTGSPTEEIEPGIFQVKGKKPFAFLVNSDGIDKGYPTAVDQLELYDGVVDVIYSLDIEQACVELQAELPRLSSMGSQDDISLAGIVDMSFDWNSIHTASGQTESTPDCEESSSEQGSGVAPDDEGSCATKEDEESQEAAEDGGSCVVPEDENPEVPSDSETEPVEDFVKEQDEPTCDNEEISDEALEAPVDDQENEICETDASC